MTDRVGKNIFYKYFEELLFLIVVFIFIIVSQTLGEIPTYVIGSVLLGTFLAWLVRDSSSPVRISDQQSRFLFIFSLIGISGMVLLARMTTPGVPLGFYIVFIMVVGFLAFQIAVSPKLRLMIPVILLTIAVRASYWYSAQIVGTDSRMHLAYIQYYIEFSELIPEKIIYYHYYPIGHILPASAAKILGLPVRVAAFITIGLGAIGGFLVIAAVVQRVVPNRNSIPVRSQLFAALFLTLAPLHIKMSSILIPQTLMFLFVPITLFLFVATDNRLLFVGALAGGVLILTHNAPALVLIAFGGILAFIIQLDLQIDIHTVRKHSTIYSVLFLMIGIIVSWMVSDIFALQLDRILRLFMPGNSLQQATTQNVGSVSLLPRLLWPAIGLLVGGVFLTAAGIVSVRNKLEGTRTIPSDYLVAVSLLFGGFAVVTVVGYGTHIARLIPLAPVVVAPIVGFVMTKIVTSGRTGVTIGLVLMLVLPSLVFVSAANSGYSPADAPTEYRPNLQQLWISQSELHGAKTSIQYTNQMTTSGYLGTTVTAEIGIVYSPSVRFTNPQTGEWPSKCIYFYHREYFKPAFELKPPRSTNVILDVGDASLIECSS